jgi:glycosyltransferase involved in cell wall biosynthesis
MKVRVPKHVSMEIIVIDNNSSDDTEQVVRRFASESSVKLSYCFEARQGVAKARNRAVRESRGEYLGFLDDECTVRADWIEVAVAAIEEFHPLIIGGPYTGAVLPGNVPAWFKREYGDAYFLAYRFKRGFQAHFQVSEGNLFLHRKVFETQQFDEGLGMKGGELKLGEGPDLQERVLMDNPGALAFYEPNLEVAHFILPQKMRLSYHARRMMESGASYYDRNSIRLLFRLAKAFVLLALAPIAVVIRNRRAYPFWQNYVYEKVIPVTLPPIGATLERIRPRYR